MTASCLSFVKFCGKAPTKSEANFEAALFSPITWATAFATIVPVRIVTAWVDTRACKNTAAHKSVDRHVIATEGYEQLGDDSSV
mmetsp:Transcript_51020/g.119337  ORF Transcript_51020/g.119337 Transcript_51020/m.119337 type:complete len:84 (-) Transcript_51020:11-262(-)